MNTKSFTTLEYHKIIDQLVKFADSPLAKEELHALLPMTDAASINAALDETNDALSRLFAKGKVTFDGVVDIRPSLMRLQAGGTLNAIELLRICRLLDAAAHVQTYYEDRQDSLTGTFDGLDPVPALASPIRRCILSEDEISDQASPKLRDIRRQQAVTNDRIHTELNRLLSAPSSRTCLQDFVITTRQGRYCLPVKAEYKSQFPGMIHDQSSTGSTLFIEPAAVVKYNNDLRELELQEQAEIEVILATLSAKAAEYTEILAADLTLLTRLDVVFARAALSRHFQCSRPVINTNGYINIRKGRHPLIDPKTVVPIDIYLGKEFQLLIITGPNTGGKTVSLKTVGLLTLMAQAGLNIPAFDHSEIAVFDNIFADIGDEQSIEQSLSTFSSHMTNTVRILKEADANSLILFDEIGAGTDPTEGAALATAILENLHQRGIATIATTHYSELKVYALTTPGVSNACCEFDVESLRPTYRLLIGIPGKSNAFAISSKLGLPSGIIDQAAQLLSNNDIRFEDVLADLEHSRVTIEKERQQLDDYQKEVAQLREQLRKKSTQLEESKEKILRHANEEASRILRDAKEYADQTIKAMNRHGMTMKELEQQRSALREKMNHRQEKSGSRTPVRTAKKQEPKDFVPGTRVHVISMNVDGDVLDKPNAKGEVSVSLGSMNTRLSIRNLEIIRQPSAKSGSTGKNTGSGRIKMSKSFAVSPEINLLGCTVDEAVARLDKYLDDAYLAHIPQVRIVHGKGTGALRSGVSAYLRGVPYVKSFRLGQIGEGDAGVTIVEFN